MLVAILTLTFTSLFFILTDKPQEYVFTNAYINTQNWVTTYGDDTDACKEIYLNQNGDLVMVLTSDQKAEFLKYDITKTPGISTVGATLTFSNNYKTLEVVGEQDQLNIENSVRTAIFNAQFLQVLNSGTQDWELEVIVKDRNTNSVIRTYSLPQEPLNWNF